MQNVTLYLEDLKKKAQQVDLKAYEEWLENTYAEWLDASKKKWTPLAEKSHQVLQHPELIQWQRNAKNWVKPRSGKCSRCSKIKSLFKNRGFLVGLALASLFILFMLARRSQKDEKRSRSLW